MLNFKARHFKFIFLILAFLYSCENVIQSDEFLQYNVVCLLSNLERHQKVYIFKTAKLNEPDDWWFYRVPNPQDFDYRAFVDRYVIKNAKVKILCGDSVFNFKYAVIDSLSYSEEGERIKVESGKVYRLNIETVDGILISGETKVPGGFKILEPRWGDTLRASEISSGFPLYRVSVKIRWTKSEDACGYLIMHYGWGRDYYYFTVDTMLNLTFDIPQDMKEINIKVLGVDENFYKHYYYQISKVGLRNAYGVFASGFGDSVNVKIMLD